MSLIVNRSRRQGTNSGVDVRKFAEEDLVQGNDLIFV